MENKTEINESVICSGISDSINNTKKYGIRTIRKVSFSNVEKGITYTIKAEKNKHPLKHWNEDMVKEKEGMFILLEVPAVKQKKVTDHFDEDDKTKKGKK